MSILLLNAGSSSLKFSLFGDAGEDEIASGAREWSTSRSDDIREILAEVWRTEQPSAVGHRIVHGGKYSSAIEISKDVEAQLRALIELAPLHNPPSLDTYDIAKAELPEARHVAVFDTSFHATLPEVAYRYPVPGHWYSEWGIRRFGFHGLSYQYASAQAATLLQRSDAPLRLIVCHLGSGCSAAAISGGRAIDTTMGFTPLEGLMMGSRSGSIDPGIILHVQEQHGLSTEDVQSALNRDSGLLGVSGVSADMRQVLAAAEAGNARARLAVEMYVYRVRQAVLALAASLGGFDALVFTAGVGENSAVIRAKICAGMSWLGLVIDEETNLQATSDRDIAAPDSTVRVLVIRAREELAMLRDVRRLLHG